VVGVRIADGVYLFEDTCNVYVLVRDRSAVLIDFGTGRVLDHLADFGADRVTDVLITHHHRDQVQGLPRAAAAGIRIWVPTTERDLFDRVDEHWQRRTLTNYYDLRQDRFSLLEPVQVTGVVPEYGTRRFGGFDITTTPTPGHTLGSVSYLAEVAGVRLAFTGDLIYGPGQVWSVAATQWSYSGVEGVQATVLSLYELAEHAPDLVLPSHGRPIDDPPRAFALLEGRLRALGDSRRDTPWDLRAWHQRPYEAVSPHLLRNMTSLATTYVLLSGSGTALFVDFGYDMICGLPDGSDRSSRRPWLASLRSLRRDHGVDRVEVAVPTHFHDDHVAGFNLLRDVEGTEIWAEHSIADIIAAPHRHDLPCLWFDPIPTDRVLETGRPFRWREYELTLHPLPGHTRHAVAVEVEVDGRRVLATGDQQTTTWEPGVRTELLNVQYKNRFDVDDFVASARLYQRLRPDLILSSHWGPRRVTDDYLEHLLDKAEELARLHRELLPLSEVDFGTEGFGARIYPYQASVRPAQPLDVEVEVVNPFAWPETVAVEMVLPTGWTCSPPTAGTELPGKGTGRLRFTVRPPDRGRWPRTRIAADLRVGSRRFGQHAEALVDVV
jgi:glyoxylase-like metal-dependent hydrolase (beta-lactamase superfamily II)